MRSNTHQALKDWSKQTLPLLCLARYLSDRPLDWLSFLVGCQILRSSTSFLLGVDRGPRDGGRAGGRRGGPRPVPPRAGLPQGGGRRIPCADAKALLDALPSAVLADVGCYLHPRDALGLDVVLRSAFARRRRSDGCCGDDVLHHVWKRLWYRDYGFTLLQWKIARHAFGRSLAVGTAVESMAADEHPSKHLDDGDGVSSAGKGVHFEGGCLEEQLSRHLDNMAATAMVSAMKDFYFLFGECHIDYLLARKNTVQECYLGLHSHVFDFTDFAEYHPGLIEPILKECGGDATHFFEDLPHSTGARAIARRLCVLVNRGALDGGGWGLALARAGDPAGRKRALRSSNTSPLLPPRAAAARTDVVPCRRQPRRPPTLARIRSRFQQERDRQQYFKSGEGETNVVAEKKSPEDSFLEKMTREVSLRYHQFWIQQMSTRLYYDPLLEKWIQWNPESSH